MQMVAHYLKGKNINAGCLGADSNGIHPEAVVGIILEQQFCKLAGSAKVPVWA